MLLYIILNNIILYYNILLYILLYYIILYYIYYIMATIPFLFQPDSGKADMLELVEEVQRLHLSKTPVVDVKVPGNQKSRVSLWS